MSMSLIFRGIASALLVTSIVAGCAGTPKARSARYDLGQLAASRVVLPVASVEMSAVPWVAATDMNYRLLYAEPQRRFAYAEAQWAAPPAELLGQVLRRHIAGEGSCRLRVVVDELEQRFETSERSHVYLELRVQMLPVRGDGTLAQQALALREEVMVTDGNPGARAGAAATARLVERMVVQLDQWWRSLPAATLKQCEPAR